MACIYIDWGLGSGEMGRWGDEEMGRWERITPHHPTTPPPHTPNAQCPIPHAQSLVKGVTK
ncbi:hypothetical protein [Nostoc sp. CCY 9925]|uniref:hypothetical protein n=1 Tax=Nostoc sp. CCY 9925 TaxID=3103865 RepID=UPI0039C74D99